MCGIAGPDIENIKSFNNMVKLFTRSLISNYTGIGIPWVHPHSHNLP